MLIRLENIADFMIANSGTQSVNLVKVLAAFGASGSTITELSLSGNMSLEEMRARKVQWKTADKPSGEMSYAQDFEDIQLER